MRFPEGPEGWARSGPKEGRSAACQGSGNRAAGPQGCRSPGSGAGRGPENRGDGGGLGTEGKGGSGQGGAGGTSGARSRRSSGKGRARSPRGSGGARSCRNACQGGRRVARPGRATQETLGIGSGHAGDCIAGPWIMESSTRLLETQPR